MDIKGEILLQKNIEPVKVSWEWYDQANGLVKWTFTNPNSVQVSGDLLRNGYIFGDAYYPLYNDHPKLFGTQFTTVITPLQDNGLTNNSAPLVIYQDPNGTLLVGFCFTFAPNQTWSMLEGGFTGGTVPDNISFVLADKKDIKSFSITYDSVQCQGYNQQSGTSLSCPPNPFTVNSAVMNISEQVTPLFNDTIAPSGSSQTTNPTCMEMIVQGVVTMDSNMFLKGLECAFGVVPQQYRDSVKKRM